MPLFKDLGGLAAVMLILAVPIIITHITGNDLKHSLLRVVTAFVLWLFAISVLVYWCYLNFKS